MLSEIFNAMVWQRIEEHLWLSLLGLIPAILIAVPAGLYIGHTRVGGRQDRWNSEDHQHDRGRQPGAFHCPSGQEQSQHSQQTE